MRIFEALNEVKDWMDFDKIPYEIVEAIVMNNGDVMVSINQDTNFRRDGFRIIVTPTGKLLAEGNKKNLIEGFESVVDMVSGAAEFISNFKAKYLRKE